MLTAIGSVDSHTLYAAAFRRLQQGNEETRISISKRHITASKSPHYFLQPSVMQKKQSLKQIQNQQHQTYHMQCMANKQTSASIHGKTTTRRTRIASLFSKQANPMQVHALVTNCFLPRIPFICNLIPIWAINPLDSYEKLFVFASSIHVSRKPAISPF